MNNEIIAAFDNCVQKSVAFDFTEYLSPMIAHHSRLNRFVSLNVCKELL